MKEFGKYGLSVTPTEHANIYYSSDIFFLNVEKIPVGGLINSVISIEF